MGDLQVSPTPLFPLISTHLHTVRALYTQLSRLPVPVGRHPGHCFLVTAPSAHTTHTHAIFSTQVYIPVERLDLTAQHFSPVGMPIPAEAAFEFTSSGTARPLRSLRPDYIKFRILTYQYLTSREFCNGIRLSDFTRFIANKVH